ncbi:MAG: hypothetical protein R2733_14370 [Acidimicrobiales bacterium]
MTPIARARNTLAAVVLSIGLGACAFPGDSLEDGEGIVGVYSVNGVDPGGVEYSGTVTIVATDDPDIYNMEWLVTGGIHEGVGRLRGNTLDVEWSTTASAIEITEGTATYTVDEDGNLIGERVTFGEDGVGTEEIFPEP